MKYVITNVDESSDRTLTAKWSFDRAAGGVLQFSAEQFFPTASYAGELLWNAASGSFYVRNDFNTAWRLAANAPATAPFVVIGSTGSLTNEHALTSSPSIRVTDLGANSTVNLAINNGVVATVSGTTFSGPVVATFGLSGSIQRLQSEVSFIVAGSGISAVTNSSGQVLIADSVVTSSSDADRHGSYLTFASASLLVNERELSVSGSSLAINDGGSLATLDIKPTGSAMITNGFGVAVNNGGFVTSGSTSWFGQDFQFVTGSSAQPFSNATTTFRSALSLTASNLSSGIYRVGWTYTFYRGTATVSFSSRIFLLNSASHLHLEEVSDTRANERYMQCGSAHVRITGSVGLFAIEAANESGAAALRLYDRAIELWRVS